MTMSFADFLNNWPESRKNSFSYEGFRALFDYFDQYAEDTGEEIEYDPVAFDCEYTEYESAREAYKEYQRDDSEPEGENDNEKEENAKEWLQDRTQVIEVEGGAIIIAQF